MKRLFACLALSLAGCNNLEGPPLTIGHLVPADDPARAAAQVNGLKMALDELGAKADPALQNRPLAIRMISVKSPDEYESQAVRLSSLGKAFALIGGTNLEETERLDHLRMPLLSFASRRSSVLSENTVTMGSDAEDRAEAAVAWLQSLGVKQATLVKSENGQADAAAFQKAWKAHMTGAGSSLKEVNDGEKAVGEVLIFTESPGKGTIDGQAKHVLLLGPDIEAERAAGLKPNSPQIHWIAPFAIDPQVKTTGEFAEKYQKQFQQAPTTDAVLAYDGLKMMLQAMRNLRGSTGDKLAKELDAVKYEGVTGPVRIEKGRLRRPLFVVHAASEGTSPTVFRWSPPAAKK